MKTLNTFEFGSSAKGSHDWDKLLDGQIYQIEPGKDFTCKPTTFLTLARKQASARGMRLRTASVTDGLVIQAIRETGEAIPAKPQAEVVTPPIEPTPKRGAKGKSAGTAVA